MLCYEVVGRCIIHPGGKSTLKWAEVDMDFWSPEETMAQQVRVVPQYCHWATNCHIWLVCSPVVKLSCLLLPTWIHCPHVYHSTHVWPFLDWLTYIEHHCDREQSRLDNRPVYTGLVLEDKDLTAATGLHTSTDVSPALVHNYYVIIHISPVHQLY